MLKSTVNGADNARWRYAEKRVHSMSSSLFLGTSLSDLFGSLQSSRLLLFLQIGSRYHSLSRITCEHNEPPLELWTF